MTDFLDKAPLPTTASSKDVTVVAAPRCVHCEQEIVHDSFRSNQWASVASGSRYCEGLRHEPAAPVGEPLRGLYNELINIAAEVVRGHGFLSSYDDLSAQKLELFSIATKQDGRLKDWAWRIRQVANKISGMLAAPVKTAPSLFAIGVQVGLETAALAIERHVPTAVHGLQQELANVVRQLKADQIAAPLKTAPPLIQDEAERRAAHIAGNIVAIAVKHNNRVIGGRLTYGIEKIESEVAALIANELVQIVTAAPLKTYEDGLRDNLNSVNHCNGTVHCNTCAAVQGADLRW